MLRALHNKLNSVNSILKLILLLSMILISAISIGRTFSYVVTGTPTLLNRFLNGMNPDDDLVIQKIVSHPFGDNYSIPGNLEFTFTVELGEDYANESVKTTQGEMTADENGVWKSLGTQTITYELEEQPDPADPEKTVLVPKPDFDKFDFSEMIRSYAFENAGTYSFRVTEVEGTIGGLTYDKAESKFDVLVGDADMDGYLEIRSVETSTPANTTIDGMQVNIAFENRYAPAGSAEAYINIVKILEDTSGQDKSPAGFTFELYDDEGRLVQFYDAEGNPVQNSRATTDATGRTSIRLIYKPGDVGRIFNYTLKEVNGGKTVGALTYDETEYQLQAAVVDKFDGTIGAYVYDAKDAVNGGSVSGGDAGNSASGSDANGTVSGSDAGGTVSGGDAGSVSGGDAGATQGNPLVPEGASNTCQVTFTNKYDPRDASVVLDGTKTLTGREMRSGEFAFFLYQTDELFTVEEDARFLSVAGNEKDGTFKFKPLTFEKVGTYHYVVMEDPLAALGGITYDRSRYLVTITVTDKEGVLTAETSITDAYGEAGDIAFTNIYKAAPVSLPLRGKKILNGMTMKENTFGFNLSVADENFIPQSPAFQTVTNDAGGTFTFKDLTFTSAGTYRYVVTEDISAPIENVTYDNTVYCITVTVSDPGDGQLVISEFTMTADGQAKNN